MYITPHTRTWLETAHHVRVLHVFDGVCNLIEGDSALLSLVVPQVGRGPFSIVVPPLRFSDVVSPDDPMICRRDSIRIGKLSVDLAAAAIWNPRPVWSAQTRDRLSHYRLLLIRALQTFAPAHSFVALIVDLLGGLSGTESAILQTARAASSDVIAGLHSYAGHSATANEFSSFQEGVTNLAGLGIGTTPAGDDWLAGGMLACWAMLPAAEAASIGAFIAGTAAPRTTPLSAAWLRAAARGECHEHWHTLLDNIRTGDEGAVWAAAAAVIRHGHTSGADGLAGFVMGLSALIDS